MSGGSEADVRGQLGGRDPWWLDVEDAKGMATPGGVMSMNRREFIGGPRSLGVGPVKELTTIVLEEFCNLHFA
jgi:hypothetical protein